MKRFAMIVAVLGLVGLSSWALSFYLGLHQSRAIIRADQGELEWLRQEFQLSDAQFQQVKRLHQDYEPICAQLCERVVESQSRLEDLIEQGQEVTPEIKAALQHCAEVKQDCQTAMLGHVYRVSARMSPEQGRRYVTMMESRILRPGTGLNHTQHEH